MHSCGASKGTNPAHVEVAGNLAKAMHEGGMKLVYGGGTTGLMGEIARTLVSLSGPGAVHGIIPEPFVRHQREQGSSDIWQHLLDEKNYGRTTIVNDMHTRKKMMADAVSNGGPGGGFVVLPGGYGTLEEMAEITAWNQLGIHAHPIVLYNADGYWNDIVNFIKKAVDEGFIDRENASIVVEAKDEHEVVSRLKDYQVAQGRFKLKWAIELSSLAGE